MSDKSEIWFDVWGCRGSRSLPPGRSRIGNLTSCYSVLCGDSLLVLDAGRGISVLGDALRSDARLRAVRTIYVMITHAHLDHWEGLKDADWFWTRGNGLDVRVHGPLEAIQSIAQGHRPPLYVPLEVLSVGSVARFESRVIELGVDWSAGPFTVSTHAMHHYSGAAENKRHLQTFGYLVRVANGTDVGPTVAYLSDHEPSEATVEVESKMLDGAHLALYDAAYAMVKNHAFGHGSIEYAALVAQKHPQTIVLAGHHGPISSDESIDENFRTFGRGANNFAIATERSGWRWDESAGRFLRGS